VGGAAALASIAIPPLAILASILGVLELAAPTLAGHALDPHGYRTLVALADFVHVTAAVVWIGGLVLLVASGSRRARNGSPSRSGRWPSSASLDPLGDGPSRHRLGRARRTGRRPASSSPFWSLRG
jgi:putative copper export protein